MEVRGMGPDNFWAHKYFTIKDRAILSQALQTCES